MERFTKKFNEIKDLADGHGLVDMWGCCYTKEADGLRNHQNDRLIEWKYIKYNILFLDTIDIL